MGATVPQLAARALRELGIVVSLDAAKQSIGPTLTALDIARRAVREAGIQVASDDRPAALEPVALAEVAAAALRAEGVNPASTLLLGAGTVGVTELAKRALRGYAINAGPDGGVPSGLVGDRYGIGIRVLQKLAVIGADDAPATLDGAVAVGHVVTIHDALTALGYTGWSVDAVPGQAIEHYVIMAANMASPEFGKAGNMEAYGAAQEALRVLSLSGPAAQARAEARVAAVHDELVAAGIADWAVDAIPSGAAEGYVMLAMHALATTYGRAPDPAMAANGAATLRRLTLSGARGQRLAEQKVRQAHEALNAQGIVSWAVAAIPAAFVGDYVAMAAILLAPVMRGERGPQDRAADAAAWDAAEARVRRAGNVRDAEERALLRVRQVHDEIAGLGLTDWTVNTVPAFAVDAYVSTVAAMMTEDGKPVDPAVLTMGMERIRRLVISGPAGQRLAEQKVRAVHASLDARGRVQWSLYDMPEYAEQPYVMMAASLLAQPVGVKADPNWWLAAERDLWRIVSVPPLRQPVVAAYF